MLATVLMSLSFVPTVSADACASDIILFFKNSASPIAVNANGVGCLATTNAGLPDQDLRYIPAGSDLVSIRYLGDAGVDTLTADVDGKTVTLTINSARTSYSSAFVAYSGASEVTAVITLPDGSTDTTTYRAL